MVSVIIPLYNTEDYIEVAIKSALNQTYSEIEIIIVDDASTDKSSIIARKYEQNDCRVKVIHHAENKGLSASRNDGINNAKGEYILFLDSDDYLEKDCIEICKRKAQQEGLDIVIFDAKSEIEGTIPDSVVVWDYDRSKKYLYDDIVSGKEYCKRTEDLNINYMPSWLMFLRKSFLYSNNIQFQDGVYYEDNKFHIDCMLKAKKVGYIPRMFYHRIYRAGSIMTTKLDKRKVISAFDISISIIETILNIDDIDIFWIEYVEKRVDACLAIIWREIKELSFGQSLEYREIVMQKSKQLVLSMMKIFVKYEINQNNNLFYYIYDYLYKLSVIYGRTCVINEILEKIRDFKVFAVFLVLDTISELKYSERKIGFYGSGIYARYVFDSYYKYGGMIKADYCFLETDSQSFVKKFMGKPIININDSYVKELDAIVVLSKKYNQLLMQEAGNITEAPVYSIYKYVGDNDYTSSETKIWEDKIYGMPYEDKKRRIIILNTPIHRNVGDYLIIQTIENMIIKYLPEYEIVKYSYFEINQNPEIVFSSIRLSDIILLGGGGYLGTLWGSGRVVPRIFKNLNRNHIVIFPQSVFFHDQEDKNFWLELYENTITNCKDISICTREKKSFMLSQELWGEISNIYLFPDTALLLTDLSRNFERQGAVICLRKDAESNITDTNKSKIVEKLEARGGCVRYSSMHYDKDIIPSTEAAVINKKIDEFAYSEMVVTDALHCMISCALTGTPCIAIDNLTGKVGGVYEWIKELKYIKFFETADEFLNFDIDNWDAVGKEWHYTLDFSKYEKELMRLVTESI